MFLISYKYGEICDTIKYKIQQGIYSPNTPLPPENTLAEEYNVSRITIRNALRSLIEDGYVYTVPGKGNYVLEKVNDKFTFSLKPESILKDPYDRVELLGSEIIKPTIELVYHLRVAPDSRIVLINWLLYRGMLPVVYDTQFIPYFPGMTPWNEDFHYTSFSEIVGQRNRLYDTTERVHIEAVPCDAEAAQRLEIAEDTPVMLITQNIVDNEDPLGMRKLYVRREFCKLTGFSYLP
ncbi:MAG: GntR family transcriptional regulator [Eubacterium sp.]|nr:GntR family transcriptional regulator [Eubacterium sp.]